MRTLKNALLYFCDFLRILLFKIPINLVTTNRGRFILVLFFGLGVALAGLHFWSSPKIISIDFPNNIEKIIAENKLEHKVVLSDNKVDYAIANVYSPAKFLEALEPGEPIVVSYYLAEIKHFSDDNGKEYAVKLYRTRARDGEVIYREEAYNSSMLSDDILWDDILWGDYITNKDSVVVVNRSAAVLIWIAGGLVCFLGWIIIWAINTSNT